MTILSLQEIADFCSIRNCRVTIGDLKKGFIRVDGWGVQYPGNYQRFLSFNELMGIQSPKLALDEAVSFLIQQGCSTKKLNREEFEREIQIFSKRVRTR